MTIRTAGPFDLELLAALHARCFEEKWTSEAYGRLLAGPGVTGFLAVAPDGAPCGFALVRAIAGEAEVLTIGVLPDYRRQGHGRALVDAMIGVAEAAGAEHLFLEVAEDNPAAQSLYRQAGFELIARRREYYGAERGRIDALVMRRSGRL